MVTFSHFSMILAASSLSSISALPKPVDQVTKGGAKVVLGTYQMRDKSVLESMIEEAVTNYGVEMVDSAVSYGNLEHLFTLQQTKNFKIGTKFHKKMHPGELLDYLKRESEERNVTFHRALLHKPLPLYMWRDLEKAVEAGLVTEIGISNIDLATLQSLVMVAKIKPSVVQAEFHPFLPDLESTLALIHYCDSQGISFEAHSVLGGSKQIALHGGEMKTAIQAISDVISAKSLIQWARLKAPNAVLCLKASSKVHLKEIMEAAREDLSGMEIKFNGKVLIDPFRLYPMDKRENLLKSSIDGNHQSVYRGKAAFGPVTLTLVDQVSELVIKDSKILSENDTNLADAEISGIAWDLYGRKNDKDTLLFTLVAVKIFGQGYRLQGVEDNLMMMVGDSKADNVTSKSLMKLWSEDKIVGRCVNLLKDRLKMLRRLMEERTTCTSSKAKSCKLIRTASDATRDEIPDCIKFPEAMPVDVPEKVKLEPFFNWLSSLKNQPHQDVHFMSGALLSGGHLDMCKQAVGPIHAPQFFETVKKASEAGVIEHLLLGNNLAFESLSRVKGPGAQVAVRPFEMREAGIMGMLEVMKDQYGLKTLYLAGNSIDGDLMERIVDEALIHNTVCQSLWLKRNPIGVPSSSNDKNAGARAIGRLIVQNKHMEVLDLHNTGLLDAGIKAIYEEMKVQLGGKNYSSSGNSSSSTLKHLHLGANGITANGSEALTGILGYLVGSLESLYLDINRLGDEGIAKVCKVMADSKVLKRFVVGSNRLSDKGLDHIIRMAQMTASSLQVLDIGSYKSTRDMQEKFNNFTNVKPLITYITSNDGSVKSDMVLKLENCGFNRDQCLQVIEAAKERGKMTVYADSTIAPVSDDDSGCGGVGSKLGFDAVHKAHSEETLKSLKNPTLVDHIFSIYRNNNQK